MRLVAVLVSVVLALAAAELLLRLVFPQAMVGFSPGMFTVGREGLAFLMPGAGGVHLTREFEVPVRANEEGYRDRPWPDPASQGRPKVLLLGDSFVFGWGVRQEESFAGLLEGDSEWVVYNAGIPGDGFPQYVARAELHVPRLKPALVVVCVYANDFTQVLHPVPVEGKTAGKDEPLAYKLKKAVQSLQLYRLAYRVGRGNALVSRLIGGAYHDQLTRDIFHEEFQLYANPPGLLDEVWGEAERFLTDLKRICDENGARLAVVCITPSYVVDPSVRGRLLELTGLRDADLHFGRVRRALSDWCGRNGVDFLDPRPDLERRLKQGKQLYYPIDMHFTAEGHQVMADFLRGHLLKEIAHVPQPPTHNKQHTTNNDP